MWSRKTWSHVYLRYVSETTGQSIVAESSQGESHKVTLDNWLVRNKRIIEIEIEIEREDFKNILTLINSSLQTKYSKKNILGILFYDLGFKKFAKRFSDGKKGLICSEEVAYVLLILGLKFDRPIDFVRPDQIIKKLEESRLGTIIWDKRN